MKSAKFTLLNWLTEGDLPRVIAGLEVIIFKHQNNPNLASQFALNTGRYHMLKEQFLKSLINDENYRVELAKVSAVFEDLIQQIPASWIVEELDSIPPSKGLNGPVTAHSPLHRLQLRFGFPLLILIFLTTVSVILFWLINVRPTDQNTHSPKQTTSTTDLKEQPQTLIESNHSPIAKPVETHITKAETIQPPAPSSNERNVDTLLKIDCKTDRGTKNLHYRSGETMRLFVQANQPCYVRFIYQFADSTLILLEDDRQINESELRKFLKVGEDFTCAAPFGRETLYVFAQSKPFDPLQINKGADEYYRIIGGLSDALKTSRRGFTKKYRFAEMSLKIETSPN